MDALIQVNHSDRVFGEVDGGELNSMSSLFNVSVVSVIVIATSLVFALLFVYQRHFSSLGTFNTMQEKRFNKMIKNRDYLDKDCIKVIFSSRMVVDGLTQYYILSWFFFYAVACPGMVYIQIAISLLFVSISLFRMRQYAFATKYNFYFVTFFGRKIKFDISFVEFKIDARWLTAGLMQLLINSDVSICSFKYYCLPCIANRDELEMYIREAIRGRSRRDE